MLGFDNLPLIQPKKRKVLSWTITFQPYRTIILSFQIELSGIMFENGKTKTIDVSNKLTLGCAVFHPTNPDRNVYNI